MYDYECPLCGFTSVQHPTKKSRDRRGKQHQDEHRTGVPAPELSIED